jgi:hypothetical protein
VDELGAFPVDIIPPRFSMLMHHLEMNNGLVGGRSLETRSHRINITTTIITIIIFFVIIIIIRAQQ